MRRLRFSRIAHKVGLDSRYSERQLMLNIGAWLWALTGLGILTAGFLMPQLGPDHVWYYRVGFTSIAVVVIALHTTRMRRVDARRVAPAAALSIAVLTAMNVSLMMLNPLSIGAVYISMIGPAVYAGNFFSWRLTAAIVMYLTFCTLLPLVVHSGALPQDHLVSRVVAFVPILWAVTFTVFALKSASRRALADGERFASLDPLTGLSNSHALKQRADEALSHRSGRAAGLTGLLMIDLDEFKLANTLYGHHGGDLVLRTIGQRLASAASKSHTVARIGGDEFAVLIEDADERDVLANAARFRNVVRSAAKILDMPGLAVDASVGTALAPRDGETLEELMTAADAAMYVEKERHSSRPARASHVEQEHVPAANPGVWLVAEEAAEDGASGFSLRWRERPAFARYACLTWMLGATIGIVSLATPDADRSHINAAVVLLLIGYLVAVVAYVATPPMGSVRHLGTDLFTLASIGLIAFLTGGADSPLWPLVFLFLIFEAWFLDASHVWLRLAGVFTAVLAPLTYETTAQIGAAAGSSLYAGLLCAIGLTAAMSYNQRILAGLKQGHLEAARRDARTGLANRREFEHRVRHQIRAIELGEGSGLAIVMIDLDNFKDVNTIHGHRAGDDLLGAIARALSDSSRTSDCVARIGGDEFAIAIATDDEQVVRGLARRLVNAVGDCAAESQHEACRRVTASAGIALYGIHGRTLGELSSAADDALMDVKFSGKAAERIAGAATRA